jgi:hypothetical protein
MTLSTVSLSLYLRAVRLTANRSGARSRQMRKIAVVGSRDRAAAVKLNSVRFCLRGKVFPGTAGRALICELISTLARARDF